MPKRWKYFTMNNFHTTISNNKSFPNCGNVVFDIHIWQDQLTVGRVAKYHTYLWNINFYKKFNKEGRWLSTSVTTCCWWPNLNIPRDHQVNVTGFEKTCLPCTIINFYFNYLKYCKSGRETDTGIKFPTIL